MKPRSPTFRATLGGVSTGLSLILLYFATITPTGTISLVAIAGCIPFFVTCYSGFSSGLLCWGATSLLGMVLLPKKTVCLLFGLFLGIYPLLKKKIEQQKRILILPLKLSFANTAFLLSFSLFGSMIFPFLPDWLQENVLLFLLTGNLLFLAYDYGLSQVFPAILGRFPPISS